MVVIAECESRTIANADRGGREGGGDSRASRRRGERTTAAAFGGAGAGRTRDCQ